MFFFWPALITTKWTTSSLGQQGRWGEGGAGEGEGASYWVLPLRDFPAESFTIVNIIMNHPQFSHQPLFYNVCNYPNSVSQTWEPTRHDRSLVFIKELKRINQVSWTLRDALLCEEPNPVAKDKRETKMHLCICCLRDDPRNVFQSLCFKEGSRARQKGSDVIIFTPV